MREEEMSMNQLRRTVALGSILVLVLMVSWRNPRVVDAQQAAPRATEVVVEGAQLELKYGITTVRDSYGELTTLMKVRDMIARGEAIGSRMLVAGNIVGWGGPFSISFAVTRDSGLSPFQEQVNDLITQGGGEELMDLTPDELRVAINKYIDKGVN